MINKIIIDGQEFDLSENKLYECRTCGSISECKDIKLTTIEDEEIGVKMCNNCIDDFFEIIDDKIIFKKGYIKYKQ